MALNSQLKVIEFGCHDGRYNMALDRGLFDSCEADPRDVFLRFYTWLPPALSLGHFDSPEAIDAAKARRDGVQVVTRPTGGRVVLHKGDLTYTIVLPRRVGATAADVYIMISECLVAGLASLGAGVEMSRGSLGRSVSRNKPCFLSLARHEIVHGGKKVVGSAQRMGRNVVLQHGSIPIGQGYLAVVDYLVCSEEERRSLADEMQIGTTCLETILGKSLDPADVAAALLGAFAAKFGKATGWAPQAAYRMGLAGRLPQAP
jgi:lipoyl(octanoyl) transferase